MLGRKKKKKRSSSYRGRGRELHRRRSRDCPYPVDQRKGKCTFCGEGRVTPLEKEKETSRICKRQTNPKRPLVAGKRRKKTPGAEKKKGKCRRLRKGGGGKG